MLNRVILIGRLANEPQLSYTPSGVAVATFALAVSRPQTAEGKQQNKEPETDFIDLVCWRQQAEFASTYLNKGRLVAIEGRLQVRKFVSNGQSRKTVEVIVDKLESLERPRDPDTVADRVAGANDEPL